MALKKMKLSLFAVVQLSLSGSYDTMSGKVEGILGIRFK